MEAFPTPAHEVTTHICYAAVFGDGVTRDELVRRSRYQTSQVEDVLSGLVREGKVKERGGWYSLPTVATSPASKRQRRALAKQIVRENRRLIEIVCRMPFVRVVAISGSVAYSNPRRENGRVPDLDFFVITSPHAMHIVRMPILLLLRLESFLPLRVSSRRFQPCFNYFLDGSRLEVVNESFYTATEAWAARVLKGRATYRRFLRHNAWIRRYYANGDGAAGSGEPEPHRPSAVWLLRAMNVSAFLFHWGASWVKRKVLRRPEGFALGDDLSRGVNLWRAWPSAGGYQVEVFRRFRVLYGDHFPELSSPAYLEFLFPGTTTSGIWLAGRFLSGPPDRELRRFE